MGSRSLLFASAKSTKCLLSLPNTFAASTVPISRPVLRIPDPRPCKRIRLSRNLTYSRPHRLPDHEGPNLQATVPAEDDLAQDIEPKVDDDVESATSKPWYLQVDTPPRDWSPILKRQEIPELPPDPPPLLKPILDHISIDLGLDDLTLFDLRDLDPPAALGANLLMVLGTARSEKHLHVSADRFCRWLKTTYRLSPYADGLLGRGELKLKLRRKARRLKMLSTTGASESSKVDDGIRTGWICVSVGDIEDGRDPQDRATDHADFVGFDDRGGGAKVVIQMLTQEKREELDLEDFWGKTVKRNERKSARIAKGAEDALMDHSMVQYPVLQKLST